jgi:ornithine decarboxylase
MLDYFLAFQESFNRFPGFNYEVQGVYQERVEGRITFYTYVVRQSDARPQAKKGGDRARS